VTRAGIEAPVTNWGDFQEYLDKSRQRTAQAAKEDKRRRNLGYRVAYGGPGFYDVEGTKKLADLVGRSNYGVHYRPYLSAKESADSWLNSQKVKAKTDKEKEAWNRWSVVCADLDADKTTPDNVITFSDRARGKVKAIDGYELMPRRTKEINRAYYSQFPSAEERRRINDKDKRLLKAWYQKNPTQA
jgi:hypothetical protein